MSASSTGKPRRTRAAARPAARPIARPAASVMADPIATAPRRRASEPAPGKPASRKAAHREVPAARTAPARPPARGARLELRAQPGRDMRQVVVDLYRAEPMARVRLIRDGVDPGAVGEVAALLHMSRERLMPALGLAPATVNRRARAGQPLSSEDSEKLVGLAKLLGQVHAMAVPQPRSAGGRDGFDAGQWLARWLDDPLPALGGRRPMELMDTAEGQSIVSGLLAMAQSGAFA